MAKLTSRTCAVCNKDGLSTTAMTKELRKLTAAGVKLQGDGNYAHPLCVKKAEKKAKLLSCPSSVSTRTGNF